MRFLKNRQTSRQWILKCFNSLPHYSLRHPTRVLLLAALITLAAVPGLRWLKLRTDGRALVSPTAPEVVYDQSVREQFGIEDRMVVLIRSDHPNGIFNPGTLQLVRTLTTEFKQLPGVHPFNVLSLATEPGFRFRHDPPVPETLLEPGLTNQVELDRLRADLAKIELYTGTLVSADGRYTVILLGAPAGGDNTRLYGRVLDIITSHPSVPEQISVTGAPVAEALFGIHILEDLGVPASLLGATTRSRAELGAWRRPSSLDELRLLLVRRVGLLPLAIIVMLLVFWLRFRNLPATLLPLPGVLATLLFVFGLMGWLGVPVYLTIAIVPVLLTTIGITNDIYLFNRYLTLLRQKPGGDHVPLVRETFDRLVSPVVITSLTAGIGLLSFGFSPLVPVRAFGLISSLGVVIALLYSLTVIPALLALIPPAWLLARIKPAAITTAKKPGAWFALLGSALVRRRRWVGGLLLAVVALTPIGLRKLAVQDSWMAGFDPQSDFRRVTETVNKHFHGMHLLFVSFDAPETLTGEIPASAVTAAQIVLPGSLVEDSGLLPGSPLLIFPADEPSPARGANAARTAAWQTRIEWAALVRTNLILRVPRGTAESEAVRALSASTRLRFEIAVQSQIRPDNIRALADLGAFIRRHHQEAVGGVLSPADYLSTTRFMLQSGNPGSRVLPGSAVETRLLWDYYQTAVGPERLQQIVNPGYTRSLTTVFLKDANFVDTAKLMGDIRAYERERLKPRGIRLGFAGDVALSQSLIHGIVTTQLQSLFWSLAGIFLVTSWLGGSLRWGIYCVLPSLLAVVIKFALMGWLGIPLGVATSMFAATTLGIGVNCAIHLLEGHRQARVAGASLEESFSRSLEWTGPPALLNTLAVSLGFGVLLLSQVPVNARLGLLLVLGLVNCFIVSLLLLPVLLHWRPIRQLPDVEPAA